MQSEQVNPHVGFNVSVNLLDGAFFGLGLGISSYTTILPLFIALMTDSALLVGLVAAMHVIGWQFPQLLTSGFVSRLKRYKPAVLYLSLMERLPYFALAFLALSLPVLSNDVALFLVFPVVVLLAFGGGFTATAWQSFIGKIIPTRIRGRFYGAQSASANLMLSIGAVIAGLILGTNPQSTEFAICFLLSGIAMMVSWAFLAASRETPHEPLEKEKRNTRDMRAKLWQMLAQDMNLRWFMLARILSLFAQTAIGFYALYGSKMLAADAPLLGAATGAMGLTQVFMAPLAGWLGDRYGHRRVFALGNIFMAASAGLALVITEAVWLFPVFILVGISNGVYWVNILAMTVEFGTAQERPFYIGLSNTLTAPAALIAPLLGGWLADTIGFNATFTVSIIGGILAALVLIMLVVDPMQRKQGKMQVALAGD